MYYKLKHIFEQLREKNGGGFQAPHREVLRRLSARGLISIKKGSGMSVHLGQTSEIYENYMKS